MFYLTKYHIFLLLVLAVLGVVTGFLFAEMQQEQKGQAPFRNVSSDLPKKVGVIRHLTVLDPAVAGFKEGMTQLGYIEGKNIVYDIQRAAEGQTERLRQIAQDYVQQEVDLIYAIDGVAARAALDETERIGKTHIPIVFAYAENPVETALARTFRSSGNNTTGVAIDLKGVTERKLKFLKDIHSELRTVGVFVTRFSSPEEKLLLQAIRVQASQFGIRVVEYPIENPPGPASTEELRRVAENIQPGEIDAYYHLSDAILNRIENLETTGMMGTRLGIPTMYSSEEDLRVAKGLMSYGHDLFAIGEQAAAMVDQIFKGAPPAEIPLQSPAKNLLIIDRDVAETSGITLPETLLDIADKLLPFQP